MQITTTAHEDAKINSVLFVFDHQSSMFSKSSSFFQLVLPKKKEREAPEMLKKDDMFSPKKFGEVQPKQFSLSVIARKG